MREGWDQRSYRYRPGRTHEDGTQPADREYRRWLLPVMRELPPGEPVLDLGCGAGIPTSRWLSRRFQVTGIDLSDIQTERARRLLPSWKFQ